MFPGVSLALIFSIGMIMNFLYVGLLLYIWPLVIESDPENPLKWYYPVQCSFWCKKSESDTVPDRSIDTEVGDCPNANDSLIDSKNIHPNRSQTQKEFGVIDLQEAELELVRQGKLEVPA